MISSPVASLTIGWIDVIDTDGTFELSVKHGHRIGIIGNKISSELSAFNLELE